MNLKTYLSGCHPILGTLSHHLQTLMSLAVLQTLQSGLLYRERYHLTTQARDTGF